MHPASQTAPVNEAISTSVSKAPAATDWTVVKAFTLILTCTPVTHWFRVNVARFLQCLLSGGRFFAKGTKVGS